MGYGHPTHRDEDRKAAEKVLPFFTRFWIFFFLLPRSQISTAEALESCLIVLRSQGRAQALPGRTRGRAPRTKNSRS